MWVQNFVKVAASAAILISAGAPVAQAQSSDRSPMLLIETGPSDNSAYRRMTFVKYLHGGGVNVAYRAYNRSEFAQVQDATPREMALECVNGKATSMSELRSYERKEAAAKRSGQRPETAVFCIKNVRGWEAGNKEKYLDPIFNGMPYAKDVN